MLPPVEPAAARAKAVQKHFETSLGMDDFMQRVEIALFAYGFTGDNSIGALPACLPACLPASSAPAQCQPSTPVRTQ